MNDKEIMIFIQIECNLFKDETLVKTWINENSNEEYFFQNNSPELKRLLEDIIEDIEQHGISQKDVERQFKNPYKD